MRRAAALLLALAAATSSLAGCGGERPVAARNRTVGLRLSEYRIVPGAVVAPAGALRIIVRNRGVLTHNVAVETIGDGPSGQPDVLGRTDTVHPGARAETRVFLRPGRYRLVCTIANHDDLGQYGTLTVR